jgi:hypothetical protein
MQRGVQASRGARYVQLGACDKHLGLLLTAVQLGLLRGPHNHIISAELC